MGSREERFLEHARTKEEGLGVRMALLEELGKELRKWREPSPQRLENEVSVSREGIDILSWAAPHFEDHEEVDLYLDEEKGSVGVKPVADGQRNLAPKSGSRGFFVSCTPMMRQMGVEERRRVPAEWSEKEGMLILDLRNLEARESKQA